MRFSEHARQQSKIVLSEVLRPLSLWPAIIIPFASAGHETMEGTHRNGLGRLQTGGLDAPPVRPSHQLLLCSHHKAHSPNGAYHAGVL